jgi:hypothetical protein
VGVALVGLGGNDTNGSRRWVRSAQAPTACSVSPPSSKEAKPAEIRLLADMLAQWQNWGGSLRAGNFFAVAAESVLHHDGETRLKTWPQDRRKLAASEAEVRQAKNA